MHMWRLAFALTLFTFVAGHFDALSQESSRLQLDFKGKAAKSIRSTPLKDLPFGTKIIFQFPNEMEMDRTFQRFQKGSQVSPWPSRSDRQGLPKLNEKAGHVYIAGSYPTEFTITGMSRRRSYIWETPQGRQYGWEVFEKDADGNWITKTRDFIPDRTKARMEVNDIRLDNGSSSLFVKSGDGYGKKYGSSRIGEPTIQTLSDAFGKYFKGIELPVAVVQGAKSNGRDADKFDRTDLEETKTAVREGLVLSEEDKRVEAEALEKMSFKQRMRYWENRVKDMSVKDAIHAAKK
jgi:hypothetical protein